METGEFTVLPNLKRRMKNAGFKLAFSCAARRQWAPWRSRALKKLKDLSGIDSMVRTALCPRTTGKERCDGFTRYRVEIRTEPGIIMPLYVLVPDKGKPPFPAMIACHGHGGGGKVSVARCNGAPGVRKAQKKYNYGYGADLARAGFITFCPDARGFGERREAPEQNNPLGHSCRWINNMAIPLGQTVIGMWTWDLMRLVDYIVTRQDCLPGRVGCAGLSGGGYQTLWAAALDPRIRCAVISGYFYGSQQALMEKYQNCSCNYVPHLWEYLDMGDIAAMIAPRPLMIETGSKDLLNGAGGLANVRSQFSTVKKAYRLLEAGDKVVHHVFDGGHCWSGNGTAGWLRKQLA